MAGSVRIRQISPMCRQKTFIITKMPGIFFIWGSFSPVFPGHGASGLCFSGRGRGENALRDVACSQVVTVR
jgi:hypothetical protein